MDALKNCDVINGRGRVSQGNSNRNAPKTTFKNYSRDYPSEFQGYLFSFFKNVHQQQLRELFMKFYKRTSTDCCMYLFTSCYAKPWQVLGSHFLKNVPMPWYILTVLNTLLDSSFLLNSKLLTFLCYSNIFTKTFSIWANILRLKYSIGKNDGTIYTSKWCSLEYSLA